MVNILIADDNIYYAKMLMNTINASENNDMKVTHIAIDGKETLNILQNNKIDILLLDLKMPIYSGKYILDELKKDNNEKYKQSIIVISGEPELLSEIINNTYVYYFFDKTCSFSKIIDKIEELVKCKNEEKRENIVKDKVIEQLQFLNYNLSHKGTQYLIEAILIIYQNKKFDVFNLKEDIYPIIAYNHNEIIHNVKCSINKANDYMYKVCKKETLHTYFKFFDDTKPTVKNVIYTILNKIS